MFITLLNKCINTLQNNYFDFKSKKLFVTNSKLTCSLKLLDYINAIMDRYFTSHVAHENTNHSHLRQGQIVYYNQDDSESAPNDSDRSDSTESSKRYHDNICKSSESSYNDYIYNASESDNNYDDNIERTEDITEVGRPYDECPKKGMSEEQVSKKTSCVILSKMVHVLQDPDRGNRVIFESRSSPISFHSENYDPDDNVHIRSPLKVGIAEEDENYKSSPPRMDWSNYQPLEVIHNFLDDLEYNYPSICTAGSIGKSLEGRDLKIVKISNSDVNNACVWIDAGIHAREWIAPAVATYVANHIATNFKTLPKSVTNKDWYFLPVVNPDGYVYTHTVERMWRKNRAWYSGRCVGVDLNRNFSVGWGGKGSSDVPTHSFFRGPEPFSEPESSAIRDMLTRAGIMFKVFITLHSFGEVIIFPYAFKDALCPDYVKLLEGATVMSKAINETHGNIYKVGISRDVMYGAAGTSYDWSYGEAGIPFCYLIELRNKKKSRSPEEEIEETGKEIVNCVKALMEFVDKYPNPK